MTNEERQKLIKEGCCFYCKEVGHLLQECSKKLKPCTNGTSTRSRMIAIVKNSETALAVAQNPGLGVADLAKALKNLSEKDLLDKIVSNQSSF
jgi:hypothetical protein